MTKRMNERKCGGMRAGWGNCGAKARGGIEPDGACLIQLSWLLVVVATCDHNDLVFFNRIDQSMSVINAPRPKP